MFLKKIVIFSFLFFIPACAFASGVFNYPITAKDAAEKLPELNSIECTFEQEKIFNNKTLKSGGDFKFLKDRGVIFETLYPIKSVSSYTTDQNKQINDIITGIANKNYSFINKNFNIFYMMDSGNWTFALRPKEKSPTSSQLESITIYGKNYIKKIDIKTKNGSSTSINFNCRI